MRDSATDEAVSDLQARGEMPPEFLDFLRASNGGEGFLGDIYLVLWPAEDLVEMNGLYEVAKQAPGLFLFGSDGGGEALAFDRTQPGLPVVRVPFVGMARTAIIHEADSFTQFVRKALQP